MALALVHGCRITIWRYLEDEERAFLERLYPGHIFQESNSKIIYERAADQAMANFAARTGWNEALEFIRDRINLDETLLAAAKGGHLSTIRQVHEWGGGDLKSAFVMAMGNGHCEAVTEIKKLHGSDFESQEISKALECAARGGHLEAIKFAQSWSEFKYWDLFMSAAEGGHVHVMKHLDSMGEIHPEIQLEAYNRATYGNHVNAMQFIDNALGVEVGSFELGDVKTYLTIAAEEGSLEAMKYIKTTIDKDEFELLEEFTVKQLDNILRCAAYRNQAKSMELLREWGARDFVGALTSLIDGISRRSDPILPTASLELLRSWGVPLGEFRRIAEKVESSEWEGRSGIHKDLAQALRAAGARLGPAAQDSAPA